MGDQNQHGLSRHIDSAVKYEVRKRCGFGCVKCGRAIIQYHHFDPPYKDAKQHRAEGITLLCGYCHDEAERGMLTPANVVAKNAEPACLKQGYTKSGPLFECSNPFTRLGGTDFHCQYPILYGKEIILGFDGPEEPGAPLRLQAVIYGPSGNKVFEIVDNEWRVGIGLFDVVTSANRLIIKESAGSIVFEAEFTSDRGLNITTLNMSFRGCSVRIQNDRLFVSRGSHMTFHLGKVTAQVGMLFPVNGGFSLGTNCTTFLDKNIIEFAPANELEWALAKCKDGKGAWEDFLKLFWSSEIIILMDPTGEAREDGFTLAAVTTGDCPLGAVAVFTSQKRADLANRWLVPVHRTLQFKASDLLKRMPMINELYLNPWSDISLPLPTVALRALRDAGNGK